MKSPLTLVILPGLALFIQSCAAELPNSTIRINQLGYFPGSTKTAIVADNEAQWFDVIDASGEVVFEGELTNAGYWDASGEEVKQANFSELTTPGEYRLKVEDELSYPFEIGTDFLKDATFASLKSYYFHRSGVELLPEHAGPYARPRDSMYDKVLYHESSGKPETERSTIGGWYDAGDYGKYIVNAAVSVAMMLHIHELHPDVFADATLTIPESGNGVSDLLDELKFEIDWMLTLQDEDGGVFHKVTALGFEGLLMPHDVDDQRYIIGKSTNASVTFAGALAQAAQAYKTIDPKIANHLLAAAERAWDWAIKHPEAIYAKNPEGVRTGSYNSDELSGEFFWAAVELARTTGKPTYTDYIQNHPYKLNHQLEENWRTYYPYLAYYTLARHPELASNLNAKSQLLDMADTQLNALGANPYRISIDHFVWGSNSDIMDQAMLFQMAHHVSGDMRYLNASVEMVDYLFGKNAVGTSFLTGFGEKHSMKPHHRLAISDAVEGPIPGFVVGGPNQDKQDTAALDHRGFKYPNNFPAQNYIDEIPSFASNEVCINWNAPTVFVLGYLEANKSALK